MCLVLWAIEDRVGLAGSQAMTSFVIRGLFFSKVPPGGVIFAMIFNIHAYKPAGGFSCIDIQYPIEPGTVEKTPILPDSIPLAKLDGSTA
jgi:hypothetical protein